MCRKKFPIICLEFYRKAYVCEGIIEKSNLSYDICNNMPCILIVVSLELFSN